jgi:hypothetical protein
MSVAVTTQPAVGLVVRAPVQDAEASSRAVRAGIELLKAPAFKEPLETHLKLGDVTFANVELAGFGKAQVATLVRGEPRPGASKDGGAPPASKPSDAGAPDAKGHRISVAWGVANEQIRVALAEDAQPLLVASPTKALHDVPFAKRALSKLEGASVVAVVQAGKDRKGAGGGQPVVISWGRQSEDAFLGLSATHPALRDLVRKELGF